MGKVDIDRLLLLVLELRSESSMLAAEITTPAMWYKKVEYCTTGELMNKTVWSKIASALDTFFDAPWFPFLFIIGLGVFCTIAGTGGG